MKEDKGFDRDKARILNELVNGKPPDEDVREELAGIINNILHKSPRELDESIHLFTDVARTRFYSDFITTALLQHFEIWRKK